MEKDYLPTVMFRGTPYSSHICIDLKIMWTRMDYKILIVN